MRHNKKGPCHPDGRPASRVGVKVVNLQNRERPGVKVKRSTSKVKTTEDGDVVSKCMNNVLLDVKYILRT